jgi:hypothetical protein
MDDQPSHTTRQLYTDDGWRGQSPAEGTRRKLIFDTIRGFADDLIGDVELAGGDTVLELADRIELALLQSAIEEGARERLAAALTDGIESVSPEAVEGPPRRRALFATLDRLYKDKTHWPLTPAKVADALEDALRDFDRMVDAELKRLGEPAAGASGDSDSSKPRRRQMILDVLERHDFRLYDGHGGKLVEANAVDLANEIERVIRNELDSRIDQLASTVEGQEGRIDELLEQREQARANEDTFKAQRDGALHLLRWLIGDLIPPDLISVESEEKR